MNVLFVVPPFPNRVHEYLILPSIELCILAQLLKDRGHQIDLLDMRIDNSDVEGCIRAYKKMLPDVVCIDDEPRAHCNSKRIIQLLRQKYGERIKICIRGEIPSFCPDVILERNPELDVILRYDDDYTLPKLLDVDFKEAAIKKINNIAFRTINGEITINSTEPCCYDLNELPMPYRDLYDLNKYLKRDTETIVKSSRGCPGHCLFCIKTRFEHFRLFSVERFCDEIEWLQRRGFSSFFFADDTFSFSDTRVNEFCDEIARRHMKIRWTSNMRICDINEHKLKRMKEAGAYRVFIGIETVNTNTQRNINKNLNRAQIVEKIDLVKAMGLEFHASFILGAPGDTIEDIEAMIAFVKEVQPTLVTFNLIRVYPGLDLYNNKDRYEIIMDDPFWFEKDTWSYRVVMGTQQLPPDCLEKLSRRCLLEFISQ